MIATVMTVAPAMTTPAPDTPDVEPLIVHLGFQGEHTALCGLEHRVPVGAGWDCRPDEEVCVVCTDLAETYQRTGVRP